jgi:hypothetical protein
MTHFYTAPKIGGRRLQQFRNPLRAHNLVHAVICVNMPGGALRLGPESIGTHSMKFQDTRDVIIRLTLARESDPNKPSGMLKNEVVDI